MGSYSLNDVEVRAVSHFAGMKVIETLEAVERSEDWSRVRSPARAARRLKRGFRQNIVRTIKPGCYQVGQTLYAHPDVVNELRRHLSAKIDEQFYAAVAP